MVSALVVALLAGSSAVLAAPGVTVSFSGAKEVSGVDNFAVVANVKNTGDETLRLLKDPRGLLTPNWATNVFHVSGADGAQAAFKGVQVKFSPTGAAAEKSYITLAAGESKSFTHSLGSTYKFSAAGNYKIEATSDAARFTHVTDSGALTTLVANVGAAHEAKLSGNIVARSFVGEDRSHRAKRANRFVSCSSTRQSQLTTAAKDAQTYATNTYNYIAGISSGTARYTTWFGTYSSGRKSTVQSHFNNIKNGQLANDTFDCTCTDPGVYAYVYPDQFGYIYLCGAFWNAPATGTDSKAGTLIHESSHFTKNGGTDDNAYGQTDCKALAKSNPAAAVDNADSHEYFAENNPYQS